MATKYPCRDCAVRKCYAKIFDVHFFGDDCPERCDAYDAWLSECAENNGSGCWVGKADGRTEEGGEVGMTYGELAAYAKSQFTLTDGRGYTKREVRDDEDQ